MPVLNLFAPILLSLSVAASPPLQDAGDYGFAGREIYKLSDGVFDLARGDLNGDGLGDLVVVNDRRSRIELLVRLAAEAEDFVDGSARSDAPNQVRYSGRFEIRHHPVERKVQKLAVGDFNGDGRADVGWVTQGGELELLWSRDSESGRPERRVVDELRNGCVLLTSSDLDGDGTQDLLACGPESLLAFAGGASGLGPARRLDSIDRGLDQLFVADLDGDGRHDLLYTFLNSDFPFRYRLGQADGSLGPRVDVDLPQIRSAHVTDLDGDGRADVLAVFKLSGRLSALELTALAPGKRALLRYPLRRSSEHDDGRRSFATGDLDADGTTDVIVAEPGISEVTVYSGLRGSRRLAARSFPSLVDVSHPRLGDTDGDGRAELLVVSASERMLGVCLPDAAGALPFPRTFPIEGEPAALDVADLDGDGFDDAMLVVVQGEGRSKQRRIEIWRGSSDGLTGPPDTHPVPGMKKTPDALRVTDLDHDGRPDAVAFLPGDRSVPMLLFQRGETFTADERGEDVPGMGVLAGSSAGRVTTGDVDGDGRDELLASSANFSRALSFDADEQGRTSVEVIAQFNGPASDSAISACVLADLDGQAPSELIMRDERTKELLIFERGPQGTRLIERAAAGRVEFTGLDPADVDGDGRVDLVLLGEEQFGVLFAGGRELTLAETASFDPPLERTYLDRIATGDVNADAAGDVVVTELHASSLVILSARDGNLKRALAFRVFEKKGLGEETRREPREVLCTEIDGDGKLDLALLVHDKLLVYIQE